jgi:hypothetical protein
LALYRPVIANLPWDPLDQVPLVWDAMRFDLLSPPNQQALASLRSWLQAQIATDARFSSFRELSALRLFDIVACW